MAISICIGNDSKKHGERNITIAISLYYSRLLNQFLKFLLTRCNEMLVAIETCKSQNSGLNCIKFN